MTNTTITLEQFHELLYEAYAVSVNDTLYFVGYDTDDNPYIIDGLDNDSMESMVFDLLTREYETYTEEEILGEIEELYGEELVADLVESVSPV